MTRRDLLARGLWTAAGAMALGFGASGLGRRRANAAAEAPPAAPAVERLDVSPARWRGLVSPEAWEVLFAEATERAFTSPLLAEKRAGAYLCAACFLPLFRSEAKFESGTGWPSFTAPIAGSLGTRRDFKLVLPRTEYHCARCGGHQGHVFDDGPPPTGLRYCNNGLALRFAPDGEPLPPLRTPG